jgi:hypothetical protein
MKDNMYILYVIEEFTLVKDFFVCLLLTLNTDARNDLKDTN